MTIVQTVMIFVGIPVAVVVLVAGAVYAGTSGSGRRYRPGRPFRFTPVWFLAPDQPRSEGASAFPAGEISSATAASESSPVVGSRDTSRTCEPTGGASGRW